MAKIPRNSGNIWKKNMANDPIGKLLVVEVNNLPQQNQSDGLMAVALVML